MSELEAMMIALASIGEGAGLLSLSSGFKRTKKTFVAIRFDINDELVLMLEDLAQMRPIGIEGIFDQKEFLTRVIF